MSGIFDQIINYSPPLIVSGTVNYKGTWDASTNNPPLSNPPVASTKGDYYVVSTAGTQFSISFAVGDWIISSGTAWEKVDLTDAVSSVFGRTGAVVGVSTDYSAVGLTNTAIGASSPSTGAFTTVTASSTIAATGAVTGSNLSGTNTGDQTTITGNAGSATILQTARNINGVSFNGSADITVAAAAGTLTGATLASGVTASSLTSLGTIASLVATTADINGGTIDGTTVGATTPSTVTGTTLTANGGNVVIRSGYALNLNNPANDSTAQIYNNAGGGSNEVRFLVGGADRALVTSTGLNSTAIGATTPSTGAFTTLSASGVTTIGNGAASTNGIVILDGATTNNFGAVIRFNRGGTQQWQLGHESGINGGASNAFILYDQVGGAIGLKYTTSTGLAVTGALSATGSATITGGAAIGQPAFQTVGNQAGQLIANLTNNITTAGSSFGLRVAAGTNASDYALRVLNQAGTLDYLFIKGDGAVSMTGALAIGNTVNTVSPTSPNRTVTIVIGGTTYYLAAKTTND